LLIFERVEFERSIHQSFYLIMHVCELILLLEKNLSIIIFNMNI
jgi:hypothetical protein